MQLQVPALPNGIQVASGLAGIVVVAFLVSNLSKRPNLDTIPTVGSSIKYLTKGADILRGGYEKHKGVIFKVPDLYRWVVIGSGAQFVEDMCKASDDELSFRDAINDSLNTEYTLGHSVHHNPYHFSIIRSQLTRNLGILYPDIRDEIVTAFEETLDLRGNEWKSMPAFQTVQKVVCRTSNRILVGLPLCRDPDWVDLTMRFAVDVVKGGFIIGFFPKVLAPFVVRFMTSVPGSARRGMKHLGPIIEKRRKHLDEYGKAWADKPNDFLSWLMDHPEGSQSSVKDLTLRILSVNFAAIHVDIFNCKADMVFLIWGLSGLAFQSFTQALYNLAANPQYMQPLREEVESIVEKEGWSKGALAKMRKIDSFLKESQRMEGIGAVAMSRKAMKDFTFSDGTVVPKGTIIHAASHATHLDNEIYENAGAFDPFRFANMRDEDRDGAKHSFVSTSFEYLAFGHGKLACPGRFFAANELKSMLAHLVLTYDIKLEDNSTPPRSWYIVLHIVAHPTAKVMFRKRAH
ncbi:hypothetical protein PAXINDRAFT_14916 [Paxillus involutus ATCC 200175]|uniref:Cytochrome P450 n=2 Tax=Paxillus involutus ATCC 200175 TaxID=664439 RepID=A0A0C9TYE0_PAXIN|nr:hypothetical protein PAXINDRAFT_14916 [Paxillus involutus ATCC 200175]